MVGKGRTSKLDAFLSNSCSKELTAGFALELKSPGFDNLHLRESCKQLVGAWDARCLRLSKTGYVLTTVIFGVVTLV